MKVNHQKELKNKKEEDIKNKIRDFYNYGGIYEEDEIDYGESVGAEEI